MKDFVHQEALAAEQTLAHETASSAPCSCFNDVNATLKEMGAMLNFNMLDPSPRCFVHVIENGAKRKRGNRIPLVQASFCPFCGAHYVAKATGAA